MFYIIILIPLCLPMLLFLYKLIPPKNLYTVPSVPIIPYLLSIFKKEPYNKRFERIVKPILYKYGIARVWLNRWIVLISDIDKVKEIFNNTDLYPKQALAVDHPHSLRTKLLGRNIVFSSGEEWKRHRKTANPVFHRSWSVELVGNCCKVLIDKIKAEKKDIVVLSYFKRMTLDALGKAVFNFDFNAVNEPRGIYVTLYNSIMGELYKSLYFFFPFLEYPMFGLRNKVKQDVVKFRSLINTVLEQKKIELEKGENFDEEKADLLTLMVKATVSMSEDGKPLLSKEEIINDVVVFFIAGHDTTANTLSFMLYYLSKNQDIQQKAREEVHKIMKKNKGIPDLEEQKKMHYIQAIIYETMRMKPTVTQLFRTITKNVEIGPDVIMEPGQTIDLHLYAMLHDPKYWKQPEIFNPERFLKPILNQNQPDYEFDKSSTKAWFAFGGGARSCIGNSFSLMEQKIVIAMLLNHFTFHLPPNSPNQDDVLCNATGLVYPKDLKITFKEI